MKRTYTIILFVLPFSIVFAQSAVDEIKIKSGEMGGRGKEWQIAGRSPETGVVLEITAAALPIEPNVTNDFKPSPDWFLGFLVEVLNERTGTMVFSKKYDFMPRGGLLRAADTLALQGKPGSYRTVFRFETEKIAANTRAQIIRIQEGTIKTTIIDVVTTTADPQAPVPRKRFKVD